MHDNDYTLKKLDELIKFIVIYHEFTIAQMNKYHQYDSLLLISLLSENDEFAFTELYDRYWKKLFVIAYNRLNEIETAEDIVHDVFASLWTNRNKINIESPENYLATAVKYMVLEKIRKRSKERQYKSEFESAPVFEIPVETSLHYKRILEKVNKEVNRLPEKCQLIFKYSRDERMPVKQIAEKLNISPKTVENQINKALKQLKLAARPFLSLGLVFLSRIFL